MNYSKLSNSEIKTQIAKIENEIVELSAQINPYSYDDDLIFDSYEFDSLRAELKEELKELKAEQKKRLVKC